jgi:hypothetical protein
MNVFDEIERTDATPKSESESSFAFLNRSSRPGCHPIRKMIQAWFDNYPKDEQPELCARFRSGEGQDYLAPFTELLLYEVHQCLGCTIEIHPTTSDENNRTPDFSVSRTDERAYVEATLATCQSNEQRGGDKRAQAVRDAVNSIVSPDFSLTAQERGKPGSPPPAREIKASLQKRLASLDYAILCDLAKSSNWWKALPHWLYEHDGWEITFWAVPRSPKTRGKTDGTLISATISSMVEVTTREAMKNAVTKKASRYKDIDLPFVVVVNVLDNFDDIDVMDALFGQEACQYEIGDLMKGHLEPNPIRMPSGAWISKGGPINTRISAVLFMQHASPWNLDNARALLVHHPLPKYRYNGVLTALPQKVPQEDGTITDVPGKSLHEILGIERGWLGGGEHP